MTCVAGHVSEIDFTGEYKRWEYPPPETLFNAPVRTTIAEVGAAIACPIGSSADLTKDKKPIAENIERGARYANTLIIWTDCDLEGEHIGSEIRDLARRTKPAIEVKRARFSNIERASVGNSAKPALKCP